MKNLLFKEFRLAIHPTSFLFLGLSLMMLIPSYPLLVTFFYMCLSIFFTCLSGRENSDLYYMALLPVKKRDIVSGRILSSVMLELAQIALCAVVAIVKLKFIPLGNDAGMDVNAALFGDAFIMFALFNAVFFLRYFKMPDKVGSTFAISSIAIFLFICVEEAITFAVPFVRECIDNALPEYTGYRLIWLAVGIVIYITVTCLTAHFSKKRFEKLDI